MSIPEPVSSHEIAIYIDNAHQMLNVATHNLRDGRRAGDSRAIPQQAFEGNCSFPATLYQTWTH